VKPAKIEVEEVSVMSVADAVRLFESNRGRPVVTRLALEAFGGLRHSSASRLEKHEIDWEGKALIFPAKKHKSKRTQYVEGYPEILWEWLRCAMPEVWEMNENICMKEKSAAFKRAGIVNPGNVLRHSFCSYHVALNRDAARTAVLLTHTSPSMLYRHYKGKATSADAARWFSILPK
jgi:integrase